MKETLVFAPCIVVHRFRRTVAFREIEVDKKIFFKVGIYTRHRLIKLQLDKVQNDLSRYTNSALFKEGLGLIINNERIFVLSKRTKLY